MLELNLAHPLQHIVRRRIALLLGAWVDALKDPAPRDAAYSVSSPPRAVEGVSAR